MSILAAGLTIGFICSGWPLIFSSLAQEQQPIPKDKLRKPKDEFHYLALPKDDPLIQKIIERLFRWYGLVPVGEPKSGPPVEFEKSEWTHVNPENIITQFLQPTLTSPWFPRNWHNEPDKPLALATFSFMVQDSDPVFAAAGVSSFLEIRLINAPHRLRIALSTEAKEPKDQIENGVGWATGVNAIAFRTFREAEQKTNFSKYYVPTNLLSVWLEKLNNVDLSNQAIQTEKPLDEDFLTWANETELKVIPQDTEDGFYSGAYTEKPNDMRGLLGLAAILKDHFN